MFRIKFPTKRIFWIFPILRTDGMAPFCNLWNDPRNKCTGDTVDKFIDKILTNVLQ